MNKLFKKWSTPIEDRKFGSGRDIGYFLFLCIAAFLYFFYTYTLGGYSLFHNVERLNDFQKSWALKTLIVSFILVLLSPNKNKFIANLIVAIFLVVIVLGKLINIKTDLEIAISKNTREAITTKYLVNQCTPSSVWDDVFVCERNKTTTGWNGKEVTYKIKYTGSVDRVGEYSYPKGYPIKIYHNDGNNKIMLF